MKKRSKYTKDRVDLFYDSFKKETGEVQEILANTLYSYNKLLNLKGETFQEISLVEFARERGIDVNDSLFDPYDVMPTCPICKKYDKVGRKGPKQYVCHRCNEKSFTANYESISSGMNESALVWMQVLTCMLEHRTIEYTCKVCEISTTTIYRIREHLWYGMMVMMDQNLKLYGQIEVDCTFRHLNLKGYDLLDNDYPDDSVFNKPKYVPRAPHAHGTTHTNKIKNENAVNLFTACDEFGHAYIVYIGLGEATASRLDRFVDKDKFLWTVPDEDPFVLFKDGKSVHKTKAGTKSIMVADKEPAIRKFAIDRGYNFVSHKYRKKGKQLNLGKNIPTIQRVNSLHSRLQPYLDELNYSTKYIRGAVAQFMFCENTGATDEAIRELFAILVKQGLGNKVAYKAIYQTPNHLKESHEDGRLLDRFPYVDLLAVYLYHMFKQGKSVEGKQITVKYISEVTGFTGKTIRRKYNNFAASGNSVMEEIVAFFSQGAKEINKQVKQKNKRDFEIEACIISAYEDKRTNDSKRGKDKLKFNELCAFFNEKYNKTWSTNQWETRFRKYKNLGLLKEKQTISSFDSELSLAAFDYYGELRANSSFNKLNKEERYMKVNEEFHLAYSHEWWRRNFKKIVDSGLRPPLPELGSNKKYPLSNVLDSYLDKAFEILRFYNEEYVRLLNEYGRGPKEGEVYTAVSDRIELNRVSVTMYIQEARKYKKLEYEAQQHEKKKAENERICLCKK